GWTPNTTDASGRRYRYGHQPLVALWNLSRFGSAILPLFGGAEPLEAALQECASELERQQLTMLHDKLGLQPRNGEQDDSVLAELSAVLQLCETDMTIFFRKLAEVEVSPQALAEAGDD